jgi:hypothetical protein
MIQGLLCGDCGAATPRKSPSQRYCPTCSNTRQAERQRKWARENYLPDKAGTALLAAKLKSRTTAKGIEISRQEASSMADVMRQIDLEWLVRIRLPFDWAGSKNHIYAMRSQGHVALRERSKAFRDLVGWKLKQALVGQAIKNNKVWLDIFVQKPNQRGDCVNFVDMICDAVKRVIGVDDRWFSLRRVDWEICKDEPSIFIGIGQEIGVQDAIACSSCGRILPLESFPLNRSAKIGRTRNCRECRKG